MCEIGTCIAKRGEVKQVKVLGTLALIDEGTLVHVTQCSLNGLMILKIVLESIVSYKEWVCELKVIIQYYVFLCIVCFCHSASSPQMSVIPWHG